MRKHKWLAILLIQAVAAFALSFAVYNTLWLSLTMYEIFSWYALPAFGAINAYLATVKGLNNYLAWITPPAVGVVAHYAAFFWLPEAGPVFACAVLSVVGAAAGEVVKRRRE
ncbi:MAG: hypothetical protein ACOYI5_00400 [Christensenellales bacterium]